MKIVAKNTLTATKHLEQCTVQNENLGISWKNEVLEIIFNLFFNVLKSAFAGFPTCIFMSLYMILDCFYPPLKSFILYK